VTVALSQNHTSISRRFVGQQVVQVVQHLGVLGCCKFVVSFWFS